MKKYRIYRDERIRKYLIICFVLGLITHVFSLFYTVSTLDNSPIYIITILFVFIFVFVFDIVVYYILYNKVVNIIYISDGYLLFGWLFPKRIKLTEIEKVLLHYHLVISTSKRTLKIIRYNSEENIQAYQQILSTLENDSYVDCDINTDILIDNIKKGMPYKKYKKFNTLLNFINFYIILGLFTASRNAIDFIKTNESLTIITVFSLLAFYYLYVVILYNKKSKYAPQRITILFLQVQ